MWPSFSPPMLQVCNSPFPGESLRMLWRSSPDVPEKVSGCSGESLRKLRRKTPKAPEKDSESSGERLRKLRRRYTNAWQNSKPYVGLLRTESTLKSQTTRRSSIKSCAAAPLPLRGRAGRRASLGNGGGGSNYPHEIL